MRIGIAIMAHPDRADQAYETAVAASADQIVWDQGRGENDTGDRAWEALAAFDTEWSVVLQDDAVPVEGFRVALDAALVAAPRSAIGLYVGTGRPRREAVLAAVAEADEMEASYLHADELLWGVGVAMPTVDVKQFLAFSRTADEGRRRHQMQPHPYDTRIGKFFQRLNLQTFYVWPSLVDHADGESILDTQGRKATDYPRKAHRTGVRESYLGPSVRIPNHGSPTR